jgi:hypothetical protein
MSAKDGGWTAICSENIAAFGQKRTFHCQTKFSFSCIGLHIAKHMNYSDFKKKTAKWNQLAAVDLLGSYDFYTSIVTLDVIQNVHIKELGKHFGEDEILPFLSNDPLTSKQYDCSKIIMPLLVHEYTHFIDSTSTLWGMRHLMLMNAAYMANNIFGGSEAGFFAAKRFHDHVRLLRLPKYYTLVNDKIGNSRDWKFDITIGKRFSSAGVSTTWPILFVWFKNGGNGPLARSPISTISILEASAMSQEALTRTRLIGNTADDFRAVEAKVYLEEMLDYLYSHNLTEYSVCVHMVAANLGCKDVVGAFQICALLTKFVLNFPLAAFQKLAESCDISSVLEIPRGHPTVKSFRTGLKNGDLGMLFYLLCRNLPFGSHQSVELTQTAVYKAAMKIGVNLALVHQMAEIEVARFNKLRESWKIPTLQNISNSAIRNYRKNNNNYMYDFNNLDVPPVILGDGSCWIPVNNQKNQLANFDLDICFNEMYEGQEWVDRFSEACV